MLTESAIALERLLRKRHALGNTLLNVDMFERWGPKEGPEFDVMVADGIAARRDHAVVTAELTALAAESPETLRAWADAHVQLLEQFVATHSSDASQDTAVFVAREEIAGWRDVAAGSRAYVDENVFYVRVDADLHRALFGEIP